MSFRDTWSLSVRDDMLIVGNGKSMIKRLKKDLGSQFEMKDLGPTQQILGMIIIRDIMNKNLWCYSCVILHSEQVQLWYLWNVICFPSMWNEVYDLISLPPTMSRLEHLICKQARNNISPKKYRRNVTWKDIIQVVPEDLTWVYLAMVYDIKCIS